MRRLISNDPLTGIDTFHEYDSQTDETRIIHIGDSEPYLEENKRLANDNEYTKKGIKNGWLKYASIPPAFQVHLLIHHGLDVYNKEHGAAIGNLMNDPQYRFLKTTSKHHKFK